MTNQIEQLCQMTLDLPELEQYFHASEPNRKPLRVAKNNRIKSDIKLMKFGEPVQFVESSESEKSDLPVFEFTSIEVKDDVATVAFRYRVEGISGTVDFRRNGEKWEIKSHKITES